MHTNHNYTIFMKKITLLLLCLAALLTACSPTMEIQSPDGKLVVTFLMDADGRPMYQVSRNDKLVVLPSALGFTLMDDKDGVETIFPLTATFKVQNTTTSTHDETWETVWGEERLIRNHYNEMVVHLRHASGAPLDITFRAFDDGFALRYTFPERFDSLTILSEATEYKFAVEPEVWSIPWWTEYYEALWTKDLASAKDTACSPVTLEWMDGTYGFIHEAALTDYPAQNFTFRGTTVGTYLTPWQNGVAAYVTTPFATPWRFVILTDNLSDMMASRIMLNLNEPCRLSDTSWIKPMKFIGIWWGMHLKQMTWEMGPKHGATTENMKRYLDFAAHNGFGGVLAEGWNLGWEDWSHFDFTTPYADWDMNELSRYADSLGVQIIGHNETGGNAADYEAQLEDAYQYHAAHGIHAIKTGYVSPIIRTVDGLQYNRSQSGVRHYRKVIETAAKYHICIDNHEPVMPTGLQRTYPNLLTQEGVRGQEWNAWATDGGSPAWHTTVLPYTRVMAGPVDYTPGVFNFANPVYPQTRVHATLANQLALFVVLYSPLQMACDLPENYEAQPDAFQFIRDVPCDWEQSHLIDGKIGEYVIMARQQRGGQNWYIGAITNDNARSIELPLTFLEEGQTYEANIYADGEDADWRKNPYSTKISTQKVTREDVLTLQLASGGGAAIQLTVDN